MQEKRIRKDKQCACGKCKYGIFRKEGDTKKYCKQCKPPDAQSIKRNNICKCGKQPVYNFPGEKRGICCSSCKEDGMVNIKVKKCKCGKYPTFRYPDSKTSTHCKDCKDKGMIRTGGICDCGKTATFNFPGLERKYCKTCKEEGMINVRKNNTCVCNRKQPVYNFPGKKAKYCKDCKEEGMINVNSHKCDCGKNALYNYRDLRPKYCSSCKEQGMINTQAKSKKCKSEFCETTGSKKYDGYCVHCFINIFPKDKRTILAYKNSKELKVKSLLVENGHIDFIHNRAIFLGDCNSNRRIDFYKYIGDNHILCIEVDEKQHKYYNSIDEEQRYDDLYKMGYCMIFIRFNPDKYRDKEGKIRNPQLKTRFKKLDERIQHITNNIYEYDLNEKLVYIEKLFYDENK